MSMEDARLDHLTLRLDSLHDWLVQRADELDRLKDELPVGTAQRMFTVGMAAEFRKIAGSLE